MFNYLNTELPRPELGDTESMKVLLRKEQSSPTKLNISYQEMCNFDSIQVSLVPEKKGIFLKHVEYEVSSQVSNKFLLILIINLNNLIKYFKIETKIFNFLLITIKPLQEVHNSTNCFAEA